MRNSHIYKESTKSLKLWAWLSPMVLIYIYLFSSIPAIDYRSNFITKYRPVVGKMTITKVVPHEFGIVVSGVAKKYRDCPWKETNFYWGNRGSGVPLVVHIGGVRYVGVHWDKPKVNHIGDLEWDEIFIPISEAELGNIYMNARHSCSGSEKRDNWVISEFYR